MSECEPSPGTWSGTPHSWEWGRKLNLPLWPEFVLYSRNSPGWSYTHFNPSQCAFEIPMRGELTVILADRRITVRPGEAYLLPAGEYNRLEASLLCDKWSIGLCGSALNAFTVGLFHDHRHLAIGNPERVVALLRQLSPLLHERDSTSVPRVSGLAVEFLMELAATVPSKLPELLAEAVRIMEFNLGSSLRISRIASELNLSGYQLGKLFRTCFNCTPKSYFIRLKMEKAALLLRENTLTVKTIAWQLGYSDGLLFSREFHKYYGMPPRNYRKQLAEAAAVSGSLRSPLLP